MKARVAFVSKKMDIGGIEKSAIEILSRLDSNIFEVDYFYRRRFHEPKGILIDKIPNWINKQEIVIVSKNNYKKYYGFFRDRLRFWIYYLCSYLTKYMDDSIQYVFQAKLNLCEEKEYDLAIAFDGPKAYGVFHTIENIKAKRKILWIHGDVLSEKATNCVMKRYYDSFDKIITVSRESGEILKSVFPSLGTKIDTVYNYIDYMAIREKAKESFKSPFENFDGIKIVTVGRLGKDKGMMMAAECCKRLLEDGIKVKWVLCGNGPEQETIAEFIEKNRMQESFILLGNQINPYPYIYNCNIYVQPSIREGFCTTTNEAKVLCKPVVTTDVCGMKEQFENGKTGKIVEISVEGLYQGIKEIIFNPLEANKFVQRLMKIDWSTQVNYNRLLEEFIR